MTSTIMMIMRSKIINGGKECSVADQGIEDTVREEVTGGRVKG